MDYANLPVETSKTQQFAVYILFYALGVVTIIHSNFFTTATDYWMYKFRDVDSNASYNSDNKTTLQADFTANYSIVSNVSYVLFILATSRFLRSRVGIIPRTIGSLSGAVFLLILTCIFVKVDTDSWQRGFYVFTLIIGCLLTGMCGVFMVTLFEMAVKFPRSHIPTIFSGQAICGIVAALVQIFALGVGGGAQTTGLIYFLIGMLFIFFSLVGFVVAWRKSDFFRYNMTKELEARKRLEISKEIILSGIKKSKFYMLSMVIVLGGTVMVHPGVIVLVSSVDKGNGNPWNDTYFGPVVNFLFFYLFDFIGRETAIFFKKPTNGAIVFALSCCRIPLIPLILFCNATPRYHLSVVFDADYAYIIFLILFALSNGYLVNISIVSVPQVTDEKERPFAMLCVLMLMVLSLAISSAISTAIVKAL
ncbi:equilibrative nucleoside transporter 3-like [Zophobas morio]|uniref:equilibrative nucleoside transporter 3-like n=1 Tax=Zophobas morio TaxID=2755281 RepID=UPI0030836112